jgi:hypothetical protein
MRGRVTSVQHLGVADQINFGDGTAHSGLVAGAEQFASMNVTSYDGLLGPLHPAWQAFIAICVLVVTLLGIRRLAVRGPARVTNAVFFTGFLIVAITVVGTLVVSCSGQDGQRSTTEMRSPAP